MSLTTCTAARQVCGRKWLLVFAVVLITTLLLPGCSFAKPSTVRPEFGLNHKEPQWHLKPCNDTLDCTDANHALMPNFYCNLIDHHCKCEHGYELDHHGMKCNKNRECVFNFNCGEYAFCHQSRCRCQLGYVPKDNEENCHQKKCNYDRDCYQWSNTKCSILGRCSCQEGYEKSWNSETCLKIDPGSYNYNFLAQNVFTIVIISNFLLWLSIFIFILQYAKKRRLAAAAAAAGSSSSMRRALPPGMPPPPPAYDNIGYESATFPPPPPYTPTTNADNKTTSTESQSVGQQPVVSIIDAPNSATQSSASSTTQAASTALSPSQVAPSYSSISHITQ